MVLALTDIYLRKLRASGDRHEISDSGSPGLRARISKTGTIDFIVKARDRSSTVKTVTIGRYPDLSLKQARERAAEVRLALKQGRDPNADRKALRDAAKAQNSIPTLRDLVVEYENHFRSTKRIWAPRGPKTGRSGARSSIEAVFGGLLDHEVSGITIEQFATAINRYKPIRPIKGKTTANGQASRARLYLMPVLDWASGRKSYSKLGAGRAAPLKVVSLDAIRDPASGDSSVKGDRDRVLSEQELISVLPWLTYPARKDLELRVKPDEDLRPIAMRFILLTAARREEVETARWRDIDFSNGVWRKAKVKSTRGGPRGQSLPLSLQALELLRGLPGHNSASSNDLVFPNSAGGPLGNWQRLQKALHRASSTSDWHRHDLRRTAATIMQALGQPLNVIDGILGHTDPLKRENVSGAASHYLRLKRVLTNVRDPQELALSALAEALQAIEYPRTETSADAEQQGAT